MYSDRALPETVPARRPVQPGELRLAELSRTESLVVCALRGAGPVRSARAVNEHERVELRDLVRLVERYAGQMPARAMLRTESPADEQLCPFECHTLHALACLQCGLLGEAWKSLVPVWGAAEAGQALLRLQDVAEALQLQDRRVERWHFDAAFFREAALI